MSDIVLGLRLAVRMLRAGELNLLAAAIALAVAAMATVGLFSDRARLAMEQEANRLLGADLVLRWTRPIPPQLEEGARTRGLSAVSTIAFRSMVVRGDTSLLGEISAVDPGYPLRGTTRIASLRGGAGEIPKSIPASGTLWADERLFSQLNAQVGDRVMLGEKTFTLAAVLTQDPSLTLSVFGLGPRLVMARSDVAATGLMVPGSRAVYRLLIAGERDAVEGYRAWAQPRLPAGTRLEGVRDARPEIRAALERAERFLNLAALVAVALAAVAVMLATRRFHERQLDVCAMLRCFGASERRVFRLQLVQLLGIGVAASIAGCALGYLGQVALGSWLASLVGIALPQPSLVAAARATLLGVVLLAAFGLPPLFSLRKVPALRVLRREAGGPGIAGTGAYAFGIACVAGLVLWHAGDLRLGAYVLIGCLATIAAASALTWSSLRALGTARSRKSAVSWRYGIASLRRRSAATVWQVVALALGLTALLTLTLIRSDLLTAWEANLPADAPNRFLINIQPDQVAPVQELVASRLGHRPEVYPTVRGRLVAVNGVPVDPSSYGDDRARRLVEREFNLGWGERLPAHNRVVAGRWHGANGEAPGLSVEEGIARTLKLELHDRLTYDVAGVRFEAPITSLREVEWDSFRVNFFVIASTSLLASHPATHLTSFHLPAGESGLVNALLERFPNVVVIDVASLVSQVQAMIGQVSRAISFVFVFTLAAGVLVLYAGIVATHDERVREVAIMRTLGASRRQVARAHATEFAVIGAMAGVFAAAGASVLGYVIASRLLNLPYQVDPLVWLLGFIAGVAGVLAAGMLFTRRVLATPPLTSLRQIA
jgi:putative ABC transport system permease protein